MEDELDLNDAYVEKKEQLKARRGRGKKEKEEEEVITIKEFDLNSMPPHNGNDIGKGVKVVVIGKAGCFAPGTGVLYFDGTVKSVEDVKVGDVLMGDDNTPRNVLELFHNTEEMFEIIPKRGTPYTVNKSHSLVLSSKGHCISEYPKDTIIEISVEEYLNHSDSWKNNFDCFRSSGITCWEDKDITIDPYFLGIWLANTIKEDEDNPLPFHLSVINYSIKYSENLGSSINIIQQIKAMNLLNNKHIPHHYKISTQKTRLEILAGIIDTNGFYDKLTSGFDIIQQNKTLAEDIVFIARSLGFNVTLSEYENHIGTFYKTFIYGDNIDKLPTKIFQKHLEEHIFTDSLSSSFKVVSKGEGEYYGFSLNGNRRFLLSSFEVVRNTGKSTLIQDICLSKAHLISCAQIFSGTEDSNQAYSSKFPPCCIYNKLDLQAMENFVTRQKIAKDWIPNNVWALQLVDDCADDTSVLKKPIFQSIFKNGRHWNMIFILSLQYCMDILPSIRSNIDYTFILRESIQKNRKSLWENYAGIIPSFQMFEEIMNTITEDFTALVINNKSTSNKLEDCVFWYKAKPDRLPEGFKFCHPVAWEFNNERLDTGAQLSYI